MSLHPNEHNNDSARCSDFFWIILDLINELARSEEGIMEAAKTLSKISQDRWRWIMQGRIEGEKRDYITGINAAKREGRAEGAKANAIANAKSLYANGVSVEIIAKSLGMSEDEVKKYICQVALSGALEFIEKYEGESEGAGNGIIGHFGLGFYSAFMPVM